VRELARALECGDMPPRPWRGFAAQRLNAYQVLISVHQCFSG